MKKLFFASTIIAASLAACSSDEPTSSFSPKKIELSRSEAEINVKSNAFAMNLFNDVTKKRSGNPEQNFAVSPFGFTVCLSMVANAVDDNTSTSIRQLLEFDDLGSLNSYCYKMLDALPYLNADCYISTANSVWYKAQINPKNDFIDCMRQSFMADVLPMNDNPDIAAEEINKWSCDKTGGLISSVVKPEGLINSISYIANALCFKAKWNTPFKPENTRKDLFHGINEDATVDMMHGSIVGGYYKADKWESAVISYKDNAFSMIVILPVENHKLADIATSISADDINEIFNAGQARTINLSMPKFSISTEDDYEQLLADMGTTLPYVGLDGLTDYSFENPLYMKISQNAKIEVDEEGTVAAAVTGGLTTVVGTQPARVDVTLDRPFIYLIRNTVTGSIIMAGQYVQP